MGGFSYFISFLNPSLNRLITPETQRDGSGSAKYLLMSFRFSSKEIVSVSMVFNKCCRKDGKLSNGISSALHIGGQKALRNSPDDLFGMTIPAPSSQKIPNTYTPTNCVSSPVLFPLVS